MIIAANDENFAAEVIERSRSVPVVVNFTAIWCGPAQAVSHRLEDAVERQEGRVLMAEVDIDASPQTSRGYNIYSLPTIKAFRGAVEVGELAGVQPAEALTSLVRGLIPNPVDALVDLGDDVSLREAVELEPTREDAALPLAREHHARGEADEALKLLKHVTSFAADGLRARIELEQAGAAEFNSAFAALDIGEVDRGLDELLAAMPTADGRRDALRRVVVGVLDGFDPMDPVAREYRRRLADVY